MINFSGVVLGLGMMAADHAEAGRPDRVGETPVGTILVPSEEFDSEKYVVWSPGFQAVWDEVVKPAGGKPAVIEPPNPLAFLRPYRALVSGIWQTQGCVTCWRRLLALGSVVSALQAGWLRPLPCRGG